MKQKEVNQPTAEQQLEKLKALIELERGLDLENLHSAVEILKNESGAKNIRRLFFQMSLAFVSNPKMGVDEDDLFDLLALHEVINVI